MSTFLFETALSEKDLSRNDLPQKTNAKIEELITLCDELNEVPDDDSEAIDEQNDKIDKLDAEIETAIYKFTPAPEPEETDEKEDVELTETDETEDVELTETEPEEESSGNTLATVGILAGIGIAIWGIAKFMGGKK